MKVKISTIIAILLYHVVFVQLYYINIYNYFVYLGIVIIALFILSKYKTIKNDFKKSNFILFLWSIIVLISSIYNQSISGVLFIIKIVECFLVMEYFGSKKQTNSVIDIFFWLTLFYTIINDLILLRGPLLKYGYNEYYLIGNKFSVGLFHISLLVFYLQKNILVINKDTSKKVIFLILFVFSLAISFKVECSTTVLANVFIFLFVLLPKKIKKKLYNPKVMLLILIFSASVLFLFSSVLNIGIIKYIIVDLLGENIELTGRMVIYQKIPDLILKNIWLGYGYGNSSSILMDEMGAPNTQNGILECIFNYGIIGTILLVLLIYYIFYKTQKNDADLSNFPLIGYVYIFILISSVEVSIGVPIMVLLSMLNMNKYKFIKKGD